MMHAVIVDGDVSYPPTSGKRLRTLHLMVRLAGRHRVTYIARCDTDGVTRDRARQYLGDHGIEAILVHDPLPKKNGPAFLGRLALNLLSPLPYNVATHQRPAMTQAVGEYAARHHVDVWQFEWLAYLTTLIEPHGARRVAVAHNVETLLWQRYYENAKGPLQRAFLKQQWRKMERFERDFFPKADWIVAVSPDDAHLIQTRFDQPHVTVVDNGIDRAYFADVESRRNARQILFLGALDWRPNLDAVDLLLERIFPEVLAQEPAARLVLVGRNPPAKLVERIRAARAVELHADVPDVRPFLGQSGVMTVPLRIGGGSRLKILEALAVGLPVISTSVGAEGLCLEAGRDFVRADSPEEMAQALVQALRHPEPILAMAQHGRKLVLERYDWDVLAAKLEQVWENCLGQPKGGRACMSPS